VKFKYYLRGCGLGIILTVLVLGISFALRGGVMTDEKVIARAGELGMVMPGDEDSGKTVTSTEEQESTQILENTQVQENTEETEDLTGTEVTSSGDTDDGTDTAEDAKAFSVVSKVRASAPSSEAAEAKNESDTKDETDTKEESDSGKSVTIRVQKGDVCREVADKLESKGLVSDAEGFRKYMQKKGYDNRICIGSFTIKQGMTYEEIAKILVGNT
jgi:hypothetical protein